MKVALCWIFLSSVVACALAAPHGVYTVGGLQGTVAAGTVQTAAVGTVHSVPATAQTTHLLVVPNEVGQTVPNVQQTAVVDTKVDDHDDHGDVQHYTAETEVHVHRPKYHVSRPIVKVSEPEINVREPDVHVQAEPEVRVARPKYRVTQPVVKITKPELYVSQPTVHVVKPQVRVSPGKMHVNHHTSHITRPEVQVSRQEYHVLEDTDTTYVDTDTTHYVHEAPVVKPSGEKQEVHVTRTNSHVQEAPTVYHDEVEVHGSAAVPESLVDAAALTRTIVQSAVVSRPVVTGTHYRGKSIH